VFMFLLRFYQIRTALKVSPRVPHRLTVTTNGNTEECSFNSAGVYDGNVFSRIFQILYRNEEIAVNDCMIFKVHLLLDGERVLMYCPIRFHHGCFLENPTASFRKVTIICDSNGSGWDVW
ncbi:hypothetical protein XENORESO_001055, partial [Xenotaenia resolanae]